MAKTTGPTNPVTRKLIVDLEKLAKKEKVPLWNDIAWRLGRPARQRASVNVGKIERLADAEETILVPGKLLADGAISKPITVAALSASTEARAKLTAAKGKFLTISELIQKNPKGAKVRIMK